MQQYGIAAIPLTGIQFNFIIKYHTTSIPLFYSILILTSV